MTKKDLVRLKALFRKGVYFNAEQIASEWGLKMEYATKIFKSLK